MDESTYSLTVNVNQIFLRKEEIRINLQKKISHKGHNVVMFTFANDRVTKIFGNLRNQFTKFF